MTTVHTPVKPVRYTLTEPELWVVIHHFNLSLAPVSPWYPMITAAATLDQMVPHAIEELKTKKLFKDNRPNWWLAGAVKAVCAPDTLLSISERGAISTRIRKYYGTKEFFVECTMTGNNVYTLRWPFSRMTIIKMAGAQIGLREGT